MRSLTFGVPWSGCSLHRLWELLDGVATDAGLPLDSCVKQFIWKAVLEVPAISVLVGTKLDGCKPFNSQNAADPKSFSELYEVDKNNPAIQHFEDAEKLDGSGVVLLASSHAQNCACGLYDHVFADYKLSTIMRETLARLAKAR